MGFTSGINNNLVFSGTTWGLPIYTRHPVIRWRLILR